MQVLKPDTVKLPFKQDHFQQETKEFACGEITLIGKEGQDSYMKDTTAAGAGAMDRYKGM